MNLEDVIADAVERRIGARLDRLERLLQGEGGSQDLTTVPKAAKACGIHAVTVRKLYLPRLTKYRAGRTVRISVAELRRAMEEDAAGDAEAVAERIYRRGRK